MKITLENTSQLVQVVDGRSGGSVPGRVWVGHTESGIPVHCVVTRIAAEDTGKLEQFERELMECRPPEPAPQVFPLRMVI